MTEPIFSSAETRRYARHLVLKGMGGQGQQALKGAKVLVVGAGGLGSPAIAYLTASGVGTLGVVDNDTVSLSNLQRQVLHRSDAIGVSKTASAAAFAKALNPHVTIIEHTLRIEAGNAAALVGDYDFVLDGSDNLETRRAVAAQCEALERPLISGAVGMFDGQLTIFAPHLRRADGAPGPNSPISIRKRQAMATCPPAKPMACWGR